jgi:L-asparaginase
MQEFAFDSKGSYTSGLPMVTQRIEGEGVSNLTRLADLMKERHRAAEEMELSAIQRAVQLSDASRVIVTQVIETLLETARTLVGVPSKAIVLTETLDFSRPIGTGVSFNLGVALGVVQVLPPGVYVVTDGRVLPFGSPR